MPQWRWRYAAWWLGLVPLIWPLASSGDSRRRRITPPSSTSWSFSTTDRARCSTVRWGSIAPVTEQTVRATEGSVAAAFATWVVGIVVFWLFALGLPVLGTWLAVRRRRAKRQLVAPAGA